MNIEAELQAARAECLPHTQALADALDALGDARFNTASVAHLAKTTWRVDDPMAIAFQRGALESSARCVRGAGAPGFGSIEYCHRPSMFLMTHCPGPA